MHWHAYLWTGRGADLAEEAERRPTSPEFSASALPPMRTGDWLIKPAHRHAGRHDDPAEAVTWMAAEYERLAGSLLHPDRIPLADRRRDAQEALQGGVDVVWGEWLTGGRAFRIAVVCCPNWHVRHPCPPER